MIAGFVLSPSVWYGNVVNGPSLCSPLLSQSSWQALAWSGVVSAAVTISSLVMLVREIGGGFNGNGWVGYETSPGTFDLDTGRSSTPYTGSPVTRFKMNM